MLTFIQKRSQAAITVLAITAIALSACGQKDQTASGGASASASNANTASASPAVDHTGWPKELSIGFLPSEADGKKDDPKKILAADMEKALGIKVNIYEGEDYTAVIEAMRTKKIDVASYGPFSYIVAHQRSGAEAFALSAKTPETAFYHSQIIVPANSPAKSLADLKGKSMMFVDPVSTSGHLFPEMLFAKQFNVKGPEVDKLFSSTSYSGGHDKSIIAVSKGQADAAGVGDEDFKDMITQGLVKETDFRILQVSDPIPFDPMSYRNDLPASLVSALKDFFLKYDNQAYLKGNHFFPADDSKYKVIRDVADLLQLNPEKLLK